MRDDHYPEPDHETIVEPFAGSAYDRGHTHSGRGGWSGAQMRALEARGMVVKGKTHVWEQDWRLTDAGREAGRQAHEEFVQSFRDSEQRAARERNGGQS